MKKSTLFLVLTMLFVIVTGYSQQQKTLKVEYTYTSARGYKSISVLYATHHQSVYYDSIHLGNKANPDIQKIIEKSKKFFKSYATWKTPNTYVYTETIAGASFYDVEDTFDMQWTIGEETKEIAGITCQKATTSFRGRDWNVWFAPSIPYSYGPWKFRGLPGLILEAVDSNNEHALMASKIEYTHSDILSKSINELSKIENPTTVSLQKFMDLREEWSDGVNQAISKKRNSTTFSVKFRNGLELFYEWEDEATRKEIKENIEKYKELI